MTTENLKLIQLNLTKEQAHLITEAILKAVFVLYKDPDDQDQLIEDLDDLLPIIGAAIEKAEEPNGAEALTLESSVPEWKALFDKINEDSKDVSYSDVEYYANQIYNLTEEQSWGRALNIASRLRVPICVHCESTDIMVVCRECGCLEPVAAYGMYNI